MKSDSSKPKVKHAAKIIRGYIPGMAALVGKLNLMQVWKSNDAKIPHYLIS